MSTLQHDTHEGVISSLLSEHFRTKSLIALIVSSGLLKGNAATFSPHQPAELHHSWELLCLLPGVVGLAGQLLFISGTCMVY
jgi:hypothetical protein